MNEMEMIIFEIISNGGTAKGLSYEAIASAEEGNFEKADELLKEADEYLVKAHQIQTDLIQSEAAGNQPLSRIFRRKEEGIGRSHDVSGAFSE